MNQNKRFHNIPTSSESKIMRSVILTHSMYQDAEVLYPYYRLQEEGTVIVAAEVVGKIRGIQGMEIMSNMTTSALNTSDDNYLETFDLLVLPGGVKAMEKLRQDQHALTFVKRWADANKPIASICSGAQMLISARVPLHGRHLAAYPAMAVDVENAGAVFVNEPVVVDGNIISSPHYNHLAVWMKSAIEHTSKWCSTDNDTTLKSTLTEYATLMKFYGATSVRELIGAQAKHVNKLQEKLPPIRDTQPINYRQG